jgi:succinate dehydrogenase/fumarate reductase flavoprotein subunit
MTKEKMLETDVLVVGGGMAGFASAIKAREQGAEVMFVDKGYISKSGQTPWAMDFVYFDPDRGHSYDEWMAEIITAGEHICNKEWTEIILKESKQVFMDLVSYGIEIFKTEDGEPLLNSMGGTKTEPAQIVERDFVKVLRKYCKKIGIKIVDKVMITDLLTGKDGQVVGAVGIPTETLELRVFKAKAVILTTAACGFKPLSFPGYELTGDGEAMAYRAGAEISGKEFAPVHFMGIDPSKYYQFMTGISASGWEKSHKNCFTIINALGEEVKLASPVSFRELDYEAHEGRTPLHLKMDDDMKKIFEDFGCTDASGKVGMTGGGFLGMQVHGSEGIWIKDTTATSSVPGLYAAGDAAATRQQGAVYANWGFALGGAGITGARAGTGAARYAAKVEPPVLDMDQLENIKKKVFAPSKQKGGYGPRWVTQVLNHMLIPYFVLHIKKEDRMKAALTMVEFMRDHFVPKLIANDSHELRLSLETKNMILNAEMRLKASLFRTESRGRHFREDYPRRDDKNWLAWVKVKQEDGEMKLIKEMIPEEMKPDPKLSYEEKYPVRFPGE